METMNELKDGYRLFYCANGRTYAAPEKCCLFCKHCDDITYDFTHGPYMTHCELGLVTDTDEWDEECFRFEEGDVDIPVSNELKEKGITGDQVKAFWKSVRKAYDEEVKRLEPYLSAPPIPGKPIGSKEDSDIVVNELKLTKHQAELILERVLKEEGASDEDREKWHYQVVAYADDVINGRLDICAACSELQDWYLANR